MLNIFKREKIFIPILWLGILILYLVSFPGNRHENDDGYSYAFAIRQFNYSDLFISRYLIFLPFSKWIWDSLRTLGLILDPYLLLCYLSVIFSLLTLVLFYYLIRKVFKLTIEFAVLSTLLLAFSYGYWRYSVEAEVYAVSNFLVLMVFLLIPNSLNNHRLNLKVILISIIGGVGVLFYKPNFIPIFLAFPFLFIFKGKWKELGIYLGIGALFIVLSYYVVFNLSVKSEGNFLNFLLGGESSTPGNPFLSFFVTGSDLVAPNFIYGFKNISSFIHQRFPGNMIQEEVFAAKHNGIFNVIALFSLLGLIINFFILLYLRFKIFNIKPSNRISYILAIWVIVYSIVLGILDPGSPEPWLMIIIPLIILFMYLIINPILNKKQSRFWIISFILLLLFHNIIGGYLVIKDRNFDYNYYENKWIIEHAQKHDLVITLSSYTGLQYLLYFSKASICNPERSPNDWLNHLETTLKNGNQVFFDEKFIHPVDVIKFRSPELYRSIKTFLKKYSNNIKRCNSESEGALVYKLNYP